MTGDVQEVIVYGHEVAVRVPPVRLPVARGSVDVCLSTLRGGAPARSTVARTLVVEGGVMPPLTLYAVDLRALWPKGGRCWLVVRYAGQLLATAPVQLLIGG